MPAKRVRLLLLIALVVALAAGVGAVYLNRNVPVSQATWPSTPYQSEDEWIVSQTAVAVIDLAQFAGTSAPEPLTRLGITKMRTELGQPVIRFRVGSRDVAIDLRTYVWDPGAYVELARAAGAQGQARDDASSDDLATALLDFKVESFRLQNDSVSIALQKDYRNPSNHEAAALLLSAFALREVSRHFYDPRVVLCRAAAHLAVARAMRGAGSQTSPSGQLADVVLQIVAGRTGPAVHQLEKFEQASASRTSQAWARALKRRATNDWRERPAEDSPLIERLEYVRAVAAMLGVGDSFDYMTKHHLEEVPDWGWITIDAGTVTVAAGHAFVGDTILRTLTEAGQVLGISQNTPLARIDALFSKEPAVSSLDRTAGGGIQVLDPGIWSAFYRRELAHVAERGYMFYRYMLGAPDTATEFEKAMFRLLGRQPVWPLIQRFNVNIDGDDGRSDKRNVAADYKRVMAEVVPVLREKPETIPYLVWREVMTTPRGVTPIDVPQPSLWFRTLYPTGTVFQSRRLNKTKILPNDFVAHADAMHELAPWDPNVTINWSIVRCSQNGGCTPEQERENFALIAPYSVDALQRFAARSPNPEADLTRLCELSAEDCVRLADWLLFQDRFSDAAAAYQESFDRNLDRVSASNNVEWLVRYYQKSGRTSEAQRVAEGAGVVGSLDGMKALAGVLERQGKLDDAERVYRRMFESYDNGTRLLAFYMRRADATGVTPTAPDYRALLDRYFGGDVERVITTALTGQPAKGLYVRQATRWEDRFGIKKADIIVALDGIRVWTSQQEQIIYARSFDDMLRFTVWRDGRYLDVEGPFRRYLQGPQYLDEVPQRRPEDPSLSH